MYANALMMKPHITISLILKGVEVGFLQFPSSTNLKSKNIKDKLRISKTDRPLDQIRKILPLGIVSKRIGKKEVIDFRINIRVKRKKAPKTARHKK